MVEAVKTPALDESRIRKASLLMGVCLTAAAKGQPIPSHCELMGFEAEDDGDVRLTGVVDMNAVIVDFEEEPPP